MQLNLSCAGPVVALGRAPRFLVWLGLLAALGLALAFVPLFNVLGFELAFGLAVPASLAGADLGAWVVRRARLADAPTGAPLGQVFVLVGRAALLALAVLVAPLGIIALNAIRVRTCEPGFGLAAFLALPAASAVLMAATGVALGLVAGPRRVLSNALPYLVALAIALGAGWQFYAEPPVFFYNVLIGYFPGNLYDEDIALGAPLLASRLYQVACVALLLGAAAALLDRDRLAVRRARPTGRAAIALAVIAGVLAVGLRLRGGALGFAVTATDIEAHLAGRVETEHFVIHYPPGGEIADQIELIADDHEFRLSQLVTTFGIAPPPGKITSYYFASRDDKARYLGAKNVYMAKPWRREIYLHHDRFPHQVLRHEIAHVMAGEFGDPLFHVSARRVLGLPLIFNVGLIEGIAVAADWPDHFTRALTPHESVKAMVELGMVPPVERLLSTGFFAFSSAQSYTVAGSFIRFLLDRHGVAPLRELYRSGGDFAAAYGVPQADLIAAWRQMIAALALPPGTAEVVRERFRRPGILARPCPHAIARTRLRAAEHAARGDRAGAVAALREVCGMMPGEPSHLLDLARALIEQRELDEAGATLTALAGDREVSSSLRAEAGMELGRLAARRGDLTAALAALDAVAALPLDDDLARNVTGRQFAARHAGPAGDALRAYFFGAEPPGGLDAAGRLGRAAAAALAEPSLGFAHYLVGRNLDGHGTAAETAAALGHALELGLPDPRIERACATLLAETAFAAGDLAAVERAAAVMTRANQPEVIRLYGADFAARVAWRRARAPR